jgi:hypothetical protein
MALRDEIRQLENELSALHRVCTNAAANRMDSSPRLTNLAEQQWQEYAQLLESRLPGLRKHVEQRALERMTTDSHEGLNIAEQEVSRWRLFKQKDYWPALQHEPRQPSSPRGQSGDHILNDVYDAEYRRLQAAIGRPVSGLDRIYQDEINRLQRFRGSEKIYPEEGGSPRANLAQGIRPAGPNELDDIYAREFERLQRLRLRERFGQDEPVTQRALTHSPTGKRPNELDKIYHAEYDRLLRMRSGERIGDNSPRSGQQGSPTVLSHGRSAASPLDAIYRAEYDRLLHQRLGERIGDTGTSPRAGSPQHGTGKAQRQNEDLQRIYDAEVQRQLMMRAEKAPQLSPRGAHYMGDDFALELDKALLEHHIKWHKRIAATLQ